MFDMAMPWWEFIARGVAVYLVLLLMVRMSGKRTVGQFTPFDLLVVLLMSEAVSSSLSGEDHSVQGGLITAGTLLLLNALVGFISSRSKRMERALEGAPVLLGRDGKIFNDVLRKHRVGEGEMEDALRRADCAVSDVRCIFLETNGEILVLKKN